MITGHVFIATSLDGYIARPNGDIDWLQCVDTSNENHGYPEFMSKIDAIIMGRGTFETIRHFTPWPYKQPIIVLSSTLVDQPIPEHLKGKVRFSSQTPKQVMNLLESEGCARVYIDGGQVIQSFLVQDMISDLIITQIPILLGDGRPLFGHLPHDISVNHLKTQSFPSGFVQSHYEIVK
ncbi:TPA: dihydrofolate reductase family protein [Providencia rettgeri]